MVMKLVLYILLLCVVIQACNETATDNSTKIQLPQESTNDSLFTTKIKGIHLVELEVDSMNILPIDQTMLYVGNKHLFFLTKNMHLFVYDKNTGKRTCMKSILGRGRTECISLNNIFGLGDTLVINDQASSKLKMYDCFGNYCGILAENIIGQYIFPHKQLFISCDPSGHYYDNDYFMVRVDSNISIIEKYFLIPDDYKYFSYIDNSPSRIYMYNDTLRFIFPYSNCLNSFPEKTYKFCTDKEIPTRLKKDYNNSNPYDFYQNVFNNGYISDLYEFVETNKYFTFKYNIKADEFCVLANKYDTEVLSISAPNDIYDGKVTSTELWRCLVYGSHLLCGVDNYLYAYTIMKNFQVLNCYKEFLDDKQKVLYNEMIKYISNNKAIINNDFKFFIEIELE